MDTPAFPRSSAHDPDPVCLQRGTLTETLLHGLAAREPGYAAIVSARWGDTDDTTLVELASGRGARQLEVGSFARGERLARWHEALRIEDHLGETVRLAGMS